jgi:hypothetical protein
MGSPVFERARTLLPSTSSTGGLRITLSPRFTLLRGWGEHPANPRGCGVAFRRGSRPAATCIFWRTLHALKAFLE